VSDAACHTSSDKSASHAMLECICMLQAKVSLRAHVSASAVLVSSACARASAISSATMCRIVAHDPACPARLTSCSLPDRLEASTHPRLTILSYTPQRSNASCIAVINHALHAVTESKALPPICVRRHSCRCYECMGKCQPCLGSCTSLSVVVFPGLRFSNQ